MNIQLKLSKIQARVAELKRQECNLKQKSREQLIRKITDLILRQKADEIDQDVLIRTIESAIANIKPE